MSPRDTETMQAAIVAAKAQGRQEGAARIQAVIEGWFGKAIPEALRRQIERIVGELALAQRSTLGVFTSKFGRELPEH